MNAPAVKSALENGWHVFAVDAGGTSCVSKGNTSEEFKGYLRCRNEHMADRISKQVKGGCKSGIVINGNAHLDADVLGGSTTQGLVAKQGIPAAAVFQVVNRKSLVTNPECGLDWEFLNSYVGAVQSAQLEGTHPVHRNRATFGGSTHLLVGSGN